MNLYEELSAAENGGNVLRDEDGLPVIRDFRTLCALEGTEVGGPAPEVVAARLADEQRVPLCSRTGGRG